MQSELLSVTHATLNDEDQDAFIADANLERRDLVKAQKAMLLAKRYPKGTRGRGNVDPARLKRKESSYFRRKGKHKPQSLIGRNFYGNYRHLPPVLPALPTVKKFPQPDSLKSASAVAGPWRYCHCGADADGTTAPDSHLRAMRTALHARLRPFARGLHRVMTTRRRNWNAPISEPRKVPSSDGLACR